MTKRSGAQAALVAAAATLLWGALSGAAPQQPSDYISPELRAEVEKLKQGAAEPTADPAELQSRLKTLWEWANAYALTGGPIPVDFPLTFGIMNRGALNPSVAARRSTPEAANEFVRKSVKELQLKDEAPNALGSLTLSPAGPFVADSYQTIEQTYTVGETPMRTGGGIVVTANRGGVGLQSRNPAADSFVSIRTSREGARFQEARPWGRWTSFITRSTIAFRLTSGTLEPGDRVILSYGNPAGGSKGLKLQNASNDRVILPVHIDLDGSGDILTPRWPSFQVIGRERVRYLNAIAPSVVRPGEAFELAVRSEDRFKNLASGHGAPAYTITLDGKVVKRLPAGAPPMSVIEGLSLDQAGVYRYRVRAADGTLDVLSNPVRVEADPRVRVYWGETHGHTGFAEGQGSPDGYFRFGRDVARLDFLSLSEHDSWMDDSEWRTLIEKTREYLDPGKFTTLLGYEWTMKNSVGGHHNVFFRDADGKRTPAQRIPAQWTPLLQDLYAGLRAENDTDDVLIVPHAHQAGDWRQNDADMERVVEIQSGHGTFEFFGNRYLRNGFKVGFLGASDNHNGHPGYSGVGNRQQGGLAAVVASENTPDAIFDALRGRQVYATTGERILLDVRLNGALMGTVAEASPTRRIRAAVHGTAPIDTVDVIKNGRLIYQKRYLSGELSKAQTVQVKFESGTEVFAERANPRGSRTWRGKLRVEGARLTELRPPAFLHPDTFRIRRDPADPNQAFFRLNTRGRGKALLLQLEGVTRSTKIGIELEPTREEPPSPGAPDRPLADLPGAQLDFTLGALSDGLGAETFTVVRNTDSIQVQLISADRPLDQEFVYTDRDDPRPGDYYYLRAVQVDGAMAWSSPIWVGEKPR